GVLLRAGLVDEVSILISPSLVGGFSPNSFYRAPDLKSTEEVISLNLIHFERLREDIIWLRYKVTK
ncbi:MAG: dihydrofolate reductase family protein, partial [Ignavibacteria bacterium]